MGPVGDVPGGMAQVVNGYVAYGFEHVRVKALCSTKGRRDPLAVVRWGWTLLRLLAYRCSVRDLRVVVHLSVGGSFIREGSLLLCARILRARTGIHMHGSRFPSFSRRHPLLTRFICRASDSVFVLTDEMREIVSGLLTPTEKTEIVMVRNMVDVPALADHRNDTVFFAGEVGERKGADVLLSAWYNMAVQYRSGWKLIIAGPIDMDLSPYPLDESVIFLGTIPHQDVVGLQRTAKIAVLPSRHEALPMFLLESMAAGCAVISTDVGQIKELLSDDAGVLVRPADSDDLLEALAGLMENAEALEKTANRARQKIETEYSLRSQSVGLETAWLNIGKV